ncbi:uncharacterized protein LOC132723391 [Ruditapes philippinarum]|uniref:uncharacterized protein LOC132723391 n=1 Tax=Ruditapes philippinarum TaxID=129788 RepID=UPI00295A7914|nr:uncharacterized protein LOC132723391 [Ruditapes philippinarum]
MTIKIACKVRSMSGTRRLSNKEKGGVHEIRLKKHESTYAYIKSEVEKHFKGNVEPGLGDTGKEIWNIDDGGDDDNDDSDSEGTKILEENMKKGMQPHGLSYLQGGEEFPDAVIEVVKKCLMYDMTKRPSAIDIVVKLQHLQKKCSRCCKSS